MVGQAYDFFTHVTCSHYASEIEDYFITTKSTFEPILKISKKKFGTSISEHVLTKDAKDDGHPTYRVRD